jgi:hypothetical protein
VLNSTTGELGGIPMMVLGRGISEGGILGEWVLTSAIALEGDRSVAGLEVMSSRYSFGRLIRLCEYEVRC